MTDRRVAERWRRRLAVALAALTLAAVALLLPAAAPEAHAAEELRIGADTTYRVDPADAVVRVRMDVKVDQPQAQWHPPHGGTGHHDPLLLRPRALQHPARGTIDPGELRRLRRYGSRSTRRPTHRLLTVHMPDLYFRQSRSIRIEYELPGGKPRSSGDIRVGAAFVTFTAWSWGDPGRSTVRIVLPKGFTNSGYGETLKTTEEADRVLLTTGHDRRSGRLVRGDHRRPADRA